MIGFPVEDMGSCSGSDDGMILGGTGMPMYKEYVESSVGVSFVDIVEE